MKKEFILEIIKNQIAERKITADELIQLNKITRLEDPFIKLLTKEQFDQYLTLDIEKGTLNLIEIDYLIELIINLFYRID